MNDSGFAKRIVVWDFFSQRQKSNSGAVDYKWKVGIWLNYQLRFVSLRDMYKDIDIPFDEIRGVQIIEDGITKHTGSAIGYGMIAVGSTKSREVSTGVNVMIITGDNNGGAKAHTLILYKAQIGVSAKTPKSHEDYKCLMECAHSIVYEIENIIHNSQSTEQKKEKELLEAGLKQCPYCSEKILATAKKCKHCGEWLDSK
jgi:hypothetical protein